MDYKLTSTECLAARKFQLKHESCKNKFSSAAGDRFSYIITPTSLGNIIEIRCNYCDCKENVTDFSTW